MALNVCECGFANDGTAESCAACGSPLAPMPPTQVGSLLTLTKATGSDSVAVAIPAPGGVIGRAGDFSPEVFSERVSGIHANITASDTCWEIEHLGRNKSAILRAGEWIELPQGMKVGLLDGDQLRLADMLFRISIASPDECAEECATDACSQQDGSRDAEEASCVQEQHWVIACPVCGKAYEVADGDARIGSCENCIDGLDKRKIASVRPKLEALTESSGA